MNPVQEIIPNLVYSEQACLNCYQTIQDLALCSGCRRVRYCKIGDCHKEGWKDHKAFCRSFKTLRVESAKSITAMPQPTKGEDLDLIHHGNRSIWMLEDSLLETSLGREPTILESKFLYRENRCAHCWRRQVDLEQGGKGFKICGKCQIFATCSEDHFEETLAIHSVEVDINGRTQCQLYKLSSEIDEFLLRSQRALVKAANPPLFTPTWIPSRILEDSAAFSANSWKEYISSSSFAEDLDTATITNAEVYGVFIEALSSVMTILEGLKRLNPKFMTEKKSDLVLHIVGATSQESTYGFKEYEELFHLLPHLKSLNLVLVGNELSEVTPPIAPLCSHCTSAKKSRTIVVKPGLYHEILPTLTEPADLVVMINAGFAHLPILRSPWTNTLVQLIGDQIPFIWTNVTKSESNEDEQRIEELDGRGSIEGGGYKAEINPWSGMWVRPDVWESEGSWSSSHYWSGVGFEKNASI